MPFVGIGVGIGRQRFAQGGIFAAYAARVAADGGVTEAGSCVNAVSGISLNSSLLLVPSGYKSGVVYSEIPTNGDGDLTFTRASDATRVNSDGEIEVVGSGVPRLDYSQGSCPALLLEPQRTNSIRNSIASGAVVGTPGTFPTFWGNSLVGLSQEIVSIGIENGLNYIDIKFSGTATGTNCRVFLETSSAISASNGQSWTFSTYFKIINSTSEPNFYFQILFENTSVGAFITAGTQPFTPTTNLSRFTFTRTLSGGATVGAIQPMLQFALTSGNSYDFTVRIAQPQVELGGYATTPIFTTSSTVTRLADACSKTGISSLIGQTQGTIYLDTKYLSVGTTGSGRWFRVYGASNEIALAINGVNIIRSIINNQSDTITTAPLTDTGLKIAWAYNASGVVLFVNGVEYALPNGGAEVMSSLDSILFDASVNAFFAEGTISQAAIFPTRLSNTELATLTTL